MRGVRRAYDPHLAACCLAFAALFAFGLGLGQYPSLRGGAKWGIDPALGELLWVPNGDVPPFYRGG
jgi:hypothetical protein